ncbi:MAG TPA: hypothetical protein VNC18_00560 [Gemmatimonadaceae bacterium]|jgi:hypothetical protein|nr:hypothetical protein [Gemmatimonadaceae bacterium]
MSHRRIATWLALCLTARATLATAQAVTSCSVAGASGKCSPTVSLDKPGTMVNPALLALTVSPSSSPLSPLSLTASTSDMDVATGLSTTTTVTLTVQANRNWTVQVSGGTAVWSGTAGAWSAKPVSDLLWSPTSSGSGTAMSVTPTTALTGSPGPGGSGTPLYFRPVVHWLTDKPGVYTMNVVFTLTSP